MPAGETDEVAQALQKDDDDEVSSSAMIINTHIS